MGSMVCEKQLEAWVSGEGVDGSVFGVWGVMGGGGGVGFVVCEVVRGGGESRGGTGFDAWGVMGGGEESRGGAGFSVWEVMRGGGCTGFVAWGVIEGGEEGVGGAGFFVWEVVRGESGTGFDAWSVIRGGGDTGFGVWGVIRGGGGVSACGVMGGGVRGCTGCDAKLGGMTIGGRLFASRICWMLEIAFLVSPCADICAIMIAATILGVSSVGG